MVDEMPTRSSRTSRRSAPGRPPRREHRPRRAPGPAGTLLWEHVLPGEVGRGTLEDLDLHLKHAVAAPQLDELLAFVRGDPGLAAGIDRVTTHPVAQARLADPKITSRRRDRVPLRDEIQGTTPELRRVSSRHYTDS